MLCQPFCILFEDFYFLFLFFYDSAGLISITIPASVQYIGSSNFSNAKKLVQIRNLSGLELQNVSYAEEREILTDNSAFSGTITNQNGYVLYEINNKVYVMGYYGDTVTDLSDMPNTVTHIYGEAFEGNQLISGQIVLAEGLQSIGDSAFDECYDIVSVTIPSTFESMGGNAFYGCYRLAQVINKSINFNFTIGDDSWENGCVALYAIEVINAGGQSAGVFEANDDYWIFDYNDTKYLLGIKSKDVTVVNNLPAVDIINSYAFYNYPYLESVVLPEGVTTIKQSAFYECYVLESVDMSNSITNLEYLSFQNCENLTSIKFSSGLTELTSSYFQSCDKINTIVVPNDITSLNEDIFTEYLHTVYYLGSFEEWNEQVYIYGYNGDIAPITNADRYHISFNASNNIEVTDKNGSTVSTDVYKVSYEDNDTTRTATIAFNNNGYVVTISTTI